MKFAIANQFFAIANDAGVDYTNVLSAIREDYPRAADLPGPGFAAGPCLSLMRCSRSRMNGQVYLCERWKSSTSPAPE